MKTNFIACYKPLVDPKARLFCFHHAGGGASSYRNWHPSLEAIGIEVVPIQLPGRENRISEPCITNVPQLIETMAKELSPYLDRPFALWGHSMGAMLAFEFGTHLQQEAEKCPRCLFASAKGAPQHQDVLAPTSGLSDAAFIESVGRFGGLPDGVLADAEMLELVLPALRADFELCEQYEYAGARRLGCPVFCYGGIQDSTVSSQALMGWESMTSTGFTIRRFPGGHFYPQSQPKLLMSALMKDLTQVL